ncbi:unnamed protein product [Protopolystoma xenopodis]|uniref:Uncharacterized protein n=1 Tax=Protopolystoma xenopodis TaxID=117903 RepID=A0A448XDX7_9PLAT|nr:unnamed protein product [Protopolystoma xenopodis]
MYLTVNWCSWIMGPNEDPRPFSREDQAMLTEQVIEPMAADGLRTIGIAYKRFVSNERVRLTRVDLDERSEDGGFLIA